MGWSRRQVLITLGVTFLIGIVVKIAPSLSQIKMLESGVV